MSAPGAPNTGDFNLVRSSGLNGDRGMMVARIHLNNGQLRVAVDALDLQKADRLESLVSELQRPWSSANKRTNSVKTKTNHATGELSNNAATAEIFIYGRNVTDTDKINGKNMLRAVRNMAVRVVAETNRLFPGAIVNYNRERGSHESIVVASFIEAIWALQEDIPSGFRSALLNTSLTKVDVYSRVFQQRGENLDDFQLRKAQEELAQSEKKRSRDEEKRNREVRKLKHQLKPGNPRHFENVPAFRLERGDNESEDVYRVRALLEEVGTLKANNKSQAQEIDLLKMDVEESEDRHNRKGGLILESKEKLENAAKEILQLKEDTSELNLEQDEAQKKLWEAKFKIEDLEIVVDRQKDTLDSQANKIKSQASKIKSQTVTIESLTKKVRAATTKSARLGVKVMRQMVQFRHKLA